MVSRLLTNKTLRNLQSVGVPCEPLTAPFSSFVPFFENLTKSPASLLDSVKSSFLGLPSGNTAETAAGGGPHVAVVRPSVVTGIETGPAATARPCIKESFPGVFLILDRFPAGNPTASLQSLAEIGALFTDVTTLTQFHQAGREKSHVSSIHRHLKDVQLRVVQQLSPVTALDVYKAFAVLHFKPVAEVHDALFVTVMQSMDQLELPDLTSFLQARLMVDPAIESLTFGAFSESLSQKLRHSKKRNVKEAGYVVHILNLFLKYQFRDDGVLAEAVEYLRARVKGLSTRDLVSVVQSLTQLEYPAEKLFDSVVVEVLGRGPDCFSTAELAQLAASLTEAKHFDVMTDVLMDFIAVTCSKRMEKLKFAELVDLLWAYAHHMHFHHDTKLVDCLTSGLVSRITSEKQLSRDACVKLSEVVSASDMGSDNFCQILKAVASHALPVMEAFNKQELLIIARGCRKGRFVCEKLMEALRVSFENLSEELSLSDLSRILNNYAFLDVYPGDRLLELSLQKSTHPDDLSPTEVAPLEVSRLIWSLAYFNKLTVVNSRPLFDHLKNFSRSSFYAVDTQKLILSEKLIQLLNQDESCDVEDEEGLIPSPLRSELITMWRERMYFTRSVSPFQQEVSRALTHLNVDHEAEALIDNGDLSVDFMLFLGNASSEGAPGIEVVLECDGPRRCSVNAPYRPLGQTLSFKRLLKAQGRQIHVLQKEFWHKKSPSEQEQLLKKILRLQ